MPFRDLENENNQMILTSVVWVSFSEDVKMCVSPRYYNNEHRSVWCEKAHTHNIAQHLAYCFVHICDAKMISTYEQKKEPFILYSEKVPSLQIHTYLNIRPIFDTCAWYIKISPVLRLMNDQQFDDINVWMRVLRTMITFLFYCHPINFSNYSLSRIVDRCSFFFLSIR